MGWSGEMTSRMKCTYSKENSNLSKCVLQREEKEHECLTFQGSLGDWTLMKMGSQKSPPITSWSSHSSCPTVVSRSITTDRVPGNALVLKRTNNKSQFTKGQIRKSDDRRQLRQQNRRDFTSCRDSIVERAISCQQKPSIQN